MKPEQIQLIAEDAREYLATVIPVIQYGKINIEITIINGKVAGIQKGSYETEQIKF